jgi:hypothetical protein
MKKGNEDALFELYNIWTGIKQFWGAGGPAELGEFPASTDMQMAKQLKQGIISMNITAISEHLSARSNIV